MNRAKVHACAPRHGEGRRTRTRAFSLVELLTVMFIIAALIAILVPSLNAARNSAKKTATKAALNALKGSLENFRNDNQRQFARTNGYPPSHAHPVIMDESRDPVFDPVKGEFPFIETKPVVTGAHWLPAMLMGPDQLGYIDGKKVTTKDSLRYEPWKWYTADPLGTGTRLERVGFYADPGGLKTVRTEELPGRENPTLFADPETGAGPWEVVKDLPVIVDSWGQPLLYYAANANGQPANMLADKRDPDNKYTGEDQEAGPPFYFHEDNHAFTGHDTENGWDIDGPHPIAEAGESMTADELIDSSNPKAIASFARYIMDRTLLRSLKETKPGGEEPSEKTQLRPVNADSYLLISAGVDGVFGTPDDVTNFPLSAE